MKYLLLMVTVLPLLQPLLNRSPDGRRVQRPERGMSSRPSKQQSCPAKRLATCSREI